MILGLMAEAVEAGARREKAAEILGISARTMERWKSKDIGEDGRAGPRGAPANKLSTSERKHLLEVACSPEYRECSPNQIVPRLADQGIYLGSEATLYRILREEGKLHHREPTKARAKRSRPTPYTATGPNQIWSWDITYLPSRVKGIYYYLYLVLDVWSRKIVATDVFAEESSHLAANLISRVCRIEGVPREQLVIHSDNGAPMKGATLVATLNELGVAMSFSRPSVSNDNPFSESLFRTVKTRPEYPRSSFASIEEAIAWVETFVVWYNTEHRHSAIRFVTPEQRHNREEREILAKRRSVYEDARSTHPKRWSGGIRNWQPIEEVRLNPNLEMLDREVA